MVRTWALEMKKAGVTANAVIPVAATAMTKTVPYFQKAVEADERGEAMPAFFRHDLGFGTADDVAGLIAFLASDAAAGITGQAIGAGGDRLQVWTHPEAAATEYREGGWGYQDLRGELRRRSSADKLQSFGEEFLPLPEELQPEPPTAAAARALTWHPRATNWASTPPSSTRSTCTSTSRWTATATTPCRAALTEASAKYFKAEDRTPVAGPDRRGLPRTEHGRRRLHRGRPDPAQARAQQHPGLSPARPGTTTS